MNQRHQLTVITAVATLLSTAPLITVFASWTWAADSLCAVALICAVAIGTRALRTPVWGQVLAMLGALTILLTWMFGSGAWLGTVPSPATLRAFSTLLRSAGRDIHDLGIPVPDRTGLLMLTTLSIGVVAIAVDLFVVTLRRPALAGFPMLAIYWIPVLVHPDSVSIVPFMVGAIGFLWLLVADNVDRVRRFGRRFTGEGRDVDINAPSPLAAAGRRLAVVGVALAVLLPLAVPGMTDGLLDRFGQGGTGDGPGHGNGNGNGSTVNLFAALQGALNRDKPFEMLRVTTNDPDPYYLRFGVADELTMNGFGAYHPHGGKPAVGNLPSTATKGPGVTANQYRASVRVTNFSMGLLPFYGLPTSAEGLDTRWYYDSSGNVIYSNRDNTNGKTYFFDFLHVMYSPQALRTAPPLPDNDPIQKAQTRVPDVPQVNNLVAQLTAGRTTPYDKVRAIYNYFSAENGFGYALSTKTGTSGSDIVDFLANKQGYCEQYAAALAWLVRAAGIPARVAFGFTRGSAHDGDAYILTNFNLHAWTEVYFSGFGWVPFDATPTAYIAGAVSPSWAPDVNHRDSPSGVINPNPPDANGNKGSNGVNGQDPNAADKLNGASGPHGPRHQAATWPYWLLGGALLIIMIILMPALRRITLRRMRRPVPRKTVTLDRPDEAEMRVVPQKDGSIQRSRAHAAWDELMDTLVDYGITVHAAETPRRTVSRIDRMLALTGDQTTALGLLGQAEEQARYARNPREVTGLGAALRTVRAAIVHRSSGGQRLRAVLLPPSVMRQWGTAMINGTSAGVVALGRGRDLVIRAIDPRRLIPGRAAR